MSRNTLVNVLTVALATTVGAGGGYSIALLMGAVSDPTYQSRLVMEWRPVVFPILGAIGGLACGLDVAGYVRKR